MGYGSGYGYKTDFTYSSSSDYGYGYGFGYVTSTIALAAITSQTVTVGDTVSFTASATDNDPTATVSYSLTSAPSGAAINASTGAFSWNTTGVTPNTYTFSVVATGSTGGSDTKSVSITVNAAPGITVTTSGGGVSGGGGGGSGYYATSTTPTNAQTTLSVADLQAQLASLIATLKTLLLQAKAAGVSIPAGAEAYLVQPSAITHDLTLGSTSADVQTLQEFLNMKGFTVAASGAGSPGKETTYFGSRTKAALAKYQASVGVKPASGYFGPITRAYLKSIGF